MRGYHGEDGLMVRTDALVYDYVLPVSLTSTPPPPLGSFFSLILSFLFLNLFFSFFPGVSGLSYGFCLSVLDLVSLIRIHESCFSWCLISLQVVQLVFFSPPMFDPFIDLSCI